ncbi:hypothetical protein KQ247_13080 [Ruegeria pomeroyi]|jgi:hypothetical protein|uniref:Ribbon-helix-helix protein CopG domain-containing protein n=2 Tax=Ruegeria pomeroyi TaxID=89184 RepID=Q5LV21_RUEPO|nr:hypothetical protein [Ruegeria pomeroyi]AAV94186.1 hypothetical protein SPO0881 [Ruegeria pomeroyi DSS-3]MCE8508244.1 hypothetical protein [Ruegeria pomeroyi]NVK95740.1 hypothetical protein [Ruegeria pomeroyi]NVL01141.1 hypothetical protein [Ruegeria pomeroyi]QWV07761.1 hypothetical protein KQ247_13080 [Ruegeria pomeroyi]
MSEEKSSGRVTVRLSGKLGEMISEIQNETPAETPTDVVRRALIVYHSLAMAKLNGADLLIVEPGPDGEEKRSRRIFL